MSTDKELLSKFQEAYMEYHNIPSIAIMYWMEQAYMIGKEFDKRKNPFKVGDKVYTRDCTQYNNVIGVVRAVVGTSAVIIRYKFQGDIIRLRTCRSEDVLLHHAVKKIDNPSSTISDDFDKVIDNMIENWSNKGDKALMNKTVVQKKFAVGDCVMLPLKEGFRGCRGIVKEVLDTGHLLVDFSIPFCSNRVVKVHYSSDLIMRGSDTVDSTESATRRFNIGDQVIVEDDPFYCLYVGVVERYWKENRIVIHYGTIDGSIHRKWVDVDRRRILLVKSGKN